MRKNGGEDYGGKSIKGIMVEIDGDTTGLSKALGSVNKEMNSTTGLRSGWSKTKVHWDSWIQLKDIEKLLKLDPTNMELLSQKQKLLTEAVSETKEKLETLKTAAEQANVFCTLNGFIEVLSDMNLKMWGVFEKI